MLPGCLWQNLLLRESNTIISYARGAQYACVLLEAVQKLMAG